MGSSNLVLLDEPGSMAFRLDQVLPIDAVGYDDVLFSYKYTPLLDLDDLDIRARFGEHCSALCYQGRPIESCAVHCDLECCLYDELPSLAAVEDRLDLGVLYPGKELLGNLSGFELERSVVCAWART